MATTRFVYILSVLVVLILHKVLASAEVAPREPDSMLSSEVENNKQIVDEPAVKETKHLESDSKAVMTSFSEYYGISGSFIHGFIATFCMIIVSELGDKTCKQKRLKHKINVCSDALTKKSKCIFISEGINYKTP